MPMIDRITRIVFGGMGILFCVAISLWIMGIPFAREVVLAMAWIVASLFIGVGGAFLIFLFLGILALSIKGLISGIRGR